MGKLKRRKRMKSNFVSSGTIRRRRTASFQLRLYFTLSMEHSGRANVLLRCSYGNNAWTPHPYPKGDDETGQGEGCEQRRDDADPERHRKAAHRAGADIEQNGGGDECGDVGIENGGKRPRKAGVEGVDCGAGGGSLLRDG